MTLDARKIALQGIGYGALLVALQGFLPSDAVADQSSGVVARRIARPGPALGGRSFFEPPRQEARIPKPSPPGPRTSVAVAVARLVGDSTDDRLADGPRGPVGPTAVPPGSTGAVLSEPILSGDDARGESPPTNEDERDKRKRRAALALALLLLNE